MKIATYEAIMSGNVIEFNSKKTLYRLIMAETFRGDVSVQVNVVKKDDVKVIYKGTELKVLEILKVIRC